MSSYEQEYKRKTCAYCGVPGSSETADHVFAKQFFMTERRARLPKVPACRHCNEEKSKLEHYLKQVLPFGGRHPDAHANLSTMVPKRLANSPSLAATVRAGILPIWVPDPSGLVLRTSMITIESDKLERWCGLLVRGLAYFHWRTVIGAGCLIRFFAPTKAGERLLDGLLSRPASQQASGAALSLMRACRASKIRWSRRGVSSFTAAWCSAVTIQRFARMSSG